jgi:glutamate/aspartate transport system permease protein
MDWGVFLQQAPSGGMTYLGWLASGTLWTLVVSICAWIIAFTLGSILGVLRTTPLAIPRALATGYV